jgi:hypothetical protein
VILGGVFGTPHRLDFCPFCSDGGREPLVPNQGPTFHQPKPMRVLLLAGMSLLAASVCTQAHTQPQLPKDVRVLDHMVKAFAHHEVKPLPVKASALPDTCVAVPFVVPMVLVEVEVNATRPVPGSVPLVAGAAISPATPPPSK